MNDAKRQKPKAAQSENGTVVYQRQHKRGLTMPQLNALDLLASGKTDKETAELLKLSRTCVTKWRLYDPLFQATLNQRRGEIWGAPPTGCVRYCRKPWACWQMKWRNPTARTASRPPSKFCTWFRCRKTPWQSARPTTKRLSGVSSPPDGKTSAAFLITSTIRKKGCRILTTTSAKSGKNLKPLPPNPTKGNSRLPAYPYGDSKSRIIASFVGIRFRRTEKRRTRSRPSQKGTSRMASIFRATYTHTDPKTGKKTTKACRKWRVEYRGADGIVRRVTGYTDLAATKQLAARLERDATRSGRHDRPARRSFPPAVG